MLNNLRRLSGGASRETYEGERDGKTLILRRGPGMRREAALIAAAGNVGVPVPEVVDVTDDELVMTRVEGETIPRKILRDPPPGLARQCGEILARLHAIDPETVDGLEHTDQLQQFRTVLDDLDQPHPAFEIAFRWLEANRPPPARATLVHGDFRNGNLVVGAGGIKAVLDWELAHAGDPLEDLGWLCVKSWRFGADLPGGFGTYDELLDGYGRADLDRDHLRWWELMGTLKWGIMCIVQAMTHASGAVRSVELAAIGRRVCEVEWDLLRALPDA